MELVTLLHLFILAVILVSIGQLFVMVRYLVWPRLHRITHCPWCWRDAGIMNGFPAPWSSTMCSYHAQQIRFQSRTRSLTRQRSANVHTKPAAMLYAEEVER
jgi:hypothetical protein